MKFCSKCHKMIVKKVVNPNKALRVCCCWQTQHNITISNDVLSRCESEIQGKMRKGTRQQGM